MKKKSCPSNWQTDRCDSTCSLFDHLFVRVVHAFVCFFLTQHGKEEENPEAGRLLTDAIEKDTSSILHMFTHPVFLLFNSAPSCTLLQLHALEKKKKTVADGHTDRTSKAQTDRQTDMAYRVQQKLPPHGSNKGARKRN